jgi:hypothetical protein
MTLAKEKTVLQGMIDRLIEIGRRFGMEMNVEKTKVIRISRQPTQVKIRRHQKQSENVEYFSYLGSMVTNDARCTREIKSRIATAKAAFNQQEKKKKKKKKKERRRRRRSFSPANWT